jgi:hypothetical protein
MFQLFNISIIFFILLKLYKIDIKELLHPTLNSNLDGKANKLIKSYSLMIF